MSSRSVQIIGGANREQAFVDPIHNGLAVIRDRHKKTHEGKLFTSDFVFIDVARDATVFIQLTPGAIPTHTRFVITASGAAMFRLFEDDTVVNPTALTTNANRNRVVGGALPAGGIVFDRGTSRAAVAPILLTEIYYPGGSGAPVSGGPIEEPIEEWILNPLSTYVIELENLSNLDGIIATVQASFYESPIGQTS